MMLCLCMGSLSALAQPPVFRGANVIEHPQILVQLPDRLKTDSVLRVLHIGDSHVKSRLFAENAMDSVQRFFTNNTDTALKVRQVVLKVMAKNGATTKSFLQEVYNREEVLAFTPHLVIISFGANEANNQYPVEQLRQQFSALLSQLRQDCDSADFLISTPGDAMKKVGASKWVRGKQRFYTSYHYNPYVSLAANFIRLFAQENNIALWDWNKVMGGDRSIVRWYGHAYAKEDRVHLTAPGYTLQGHLLATALIQTFKNYILQ